MTATAWGTLRCSHCERISIRNGKLRLELGCLQDFREGIAQTLNRQGFEATEKSLGLLEGSPFGDDVVNLSNIDLIHQERFTRSPGTLQKLPDGCEPLFSVEKSEQGERIKQMRLLRAFAHAGVLSTRGR